MFRKNAGDYLHELMRIDGAVQQYTTALDQDEVMVLEGHKARRRFCKCGNLWWWPRTRNVWRILCQELRCFTNHTAAGGLSKRSANQYGHEHGQSNLGILHHFACFASIARYQTAPCFGHSHFGNNCFRHQEYVICGFFLHSLKGRASEPTCSSEKNGKHTSNIKSQAHLRRSKCFSRSRYVWSWQIQSRWDADMERQTEASWSPKLVARPKALATHLCTKLSFELNMKFWTRPLCIENHWTFA